MTAPSLYDRLAPEWNEVLESGAVFTETDSSFYRRPDRRDCFVEATMMDIVSETARQFNISRAELLCARRYKVYTRARFAAIWLIRDMLPHYTLSDIGRFMNRDHTTIINALEKAAYLMEKDPNFIEGVRMIREELR